MISFERVCSWLKTGSRAAWMACFWETLTEEQTVEQDLHGFQDRLIALETRLNGHVRAQRRQDANLEESGVDGTEGPQGVFRTEEQRAENRTCLGAEGTARALYERPEHPQEHAADGAETGAVANGHLALRHITL
jgi:hypothetical protein